MPSDSLRKHIRFQPDSDTFVALKLEDNSLYTGLCVSESQGGCAGVFINHESFVAGKMCLIKVGKLDAVAAEIRWVKELDSDIIKVGFQYLS